jgi:hypothetical protein
VSTQINVTVGSGGLSDKARQLQTAARQAQLEKERQQRLELEGTEQRNAKLKAEGKAPDGSPLYGAIFQQPQIDRRPAATRTGGKDVWICYCDQDPQALTVPSGFKFLYSLAGKPIVPYSFSFIETPNVISPSSQYIASGGPFGLAYVRSFSPPNFQDTVADSSEFEFPVDGVVNSYSRKPYELSGATNSFTLELDHIAYRRNDVVAGGVPVSAPETAARSSLRINLYSTQGEQLYSISAGASRTTGTGPANEIVFMSIGDFSTGGVLAVAQQIVPFGTYRALSGTWTQSTIVVDSVRCSLYLSGVKVLEAPLTAPIQKRKYLAFIEASVGSTSNAFSPTSGPYGWSANRFSSFARYTESYTMTPINVP